MGEKKIVALLGFLKKKAVTHGYGGKKTFSRGPRQDGGHHKKEKGGLVATRKKRSRFSRGGD